VIPATFAYHRARSLDDALAKMAAAGAGGRFLAGGHSLVPLMKLRLSEPGTLIDISRVAELSGIREKDGRIEIGAATVHHAVATSPVLNDRCPAVAEAARTIGDAQVRNRGTIGGGLAEADPCGDYGAVILALNAQLKCLSPRGERMIPAAEFFSFAYTTALARDEILTEVIIPALAKHSAGVYLKLERVAGDFAIASAAVQLSLDDGGSCAEVGIGVTGGHAVPTKGVAVEDLLRRKKITPELVAAAGQLIQADAEPIEDMRGAAQYKKKVLGAILRRAIAEAMRRAEAKPSS